MKKNLSRLLSLVLVLVMVLTAIPASAVNMIRDGEGDWWNWWVQPAPIGNITHPEQTLTAELEDGTTVTVIAREGVLPAKTRMTAQAITNIEAVQAAVDQTAGVSGTVLTAVDITFMNGNMEVQPNGSVKVQIASDALAGMDDLSVVHLDVDADELEGDEQAELIDNAQTNNEGVLFSARHFSVYAVIGGETGDTVKYLTVEFKDHNNETINVQKILINRIGEMIEKGITIIYDPGVPTLTDRQAFTGWGETRVSTTSDYTEGMTVEQINQYVKDHYQEWTRDQDLVYYAWVYDVTFVFYCDQYGAIFKTETVPLKNNGSGTFTYDNTYVAEGAAGQNVGLIGWVEYNSTNVITPGVGTTLPTYGDNVSYALPGAAGTTSEELVLFPYVAYGYWMTFDSNVSSGAGVDDTRASFTAPVFVKTGTQASTVKPADPTRPGYQFDKWYADANCTTPFDWSQPITSATTVYAGWTAQTVNYMVICWTQQSTDTVDSDNLNNVYDYKAMSESFELRSGRAGDPVSLATSDTTLGGSTSSTLGYFYTYNADRTNQENGTNTIIKGDGTTVLNVYYDRKVITYNFYCDLTYSSSGSSYNSGYYSSYYPHFGYSNGRYFPIYTNASTYSNGDYRNPTWYTDAACTTRYNSSGTVYFPKDIYDTSTTVNNAEYSYGSITGLWFAETESYNWYTNYTNSISGHEWPYSGTNLMWKSGLNGYYLAKVFQFETGSEYTTTVNYFLGRYQNSSTTRPYSAVAMDTNGNYANDNAHIIDEGNLKQNETVYYYGNEYYGFVLDKYNKTTYNYANATTWNGGKVGISYDDVGQGGHAYLFFKRNQWNLRFYSNGKELNNLSALVYYNKPLSGYEPSVAPTDVPAGCYFRGWFKDPACTEEFDWTQNMPNNDVMVYAGWHTEWYRLVFDITGNGKIPADTITVPGDNQKVSFTAEYGTKVQGSSLNSITTNVPGYTFGGWFYDADCTVPFNMDTAMSVNLPNAQNSYVDTNYKNTSKTGVDAKGNPWDDSPWPDVRNKLTLYALWRQKVAGADGIRVKYDAIQNEGVIAGTDPAEVIKYDPLIYTDGAVAFGRYSATPNNTELQFLYWEIRDENGQVLHKVYPGQPFPVNLEWATENEMFTITWNYIGSDGQWTHAETSISQGFAPTYRVSDYADIANDVYYRFVGWSATQNGDPADPVPAEADAEYWAVYNVEEIPVQYTVIFVDYNGTELGRSVVYKGADAVPPEDPSRVGYTFTGWDTDYTNVQSDLTVTAQYRINSYTLTINYVDALGDSIADAYSASVNYGESYSVNSPDLNGYHLADPTQATVSGTMPANNVTVEVEYLTNVAEKYYELVTAAPSDWSGNYVITYGTSTSNLSYVLKGVTPSSNGASIESTDNCSAFSDSGITLSDNILTGVSDDYVMTIAKSGSYYTVKSASTNAYYGIYSSSSSEYGYLYGYTSYSSIYCNWTPAINSSYKVQLKNNRSSSSSYFGFSTANSYFWGASSGNADVLYLWKEVTSGGGVSNTVTYEKVTSIAANDDVIIVINGYAVGNTIYSNNHYLTAKSVTVSGDNLLLGSTAEADVLWHVGGNASSGYTFLNNAVNKYMGVDSSEYLNVTDSATTWKYTSDKYLDNEIDSEGYYYLSLQNSTYFTTSKSGTEVTFYKRVATNSTVLPGEIGEHVDATPGANTGSAGASRAVYSYKVVNTPVSGKSYLIAYIDGDTVYLVCPDNYYRITDDNNNYVYYNPEAKDGSLTVNGSNYNTTEDLSSYLWTVGGSSGNWTFRNGSNYLGGVRLTYNSSNYLLVSITSSTTYNKWDFSNNALKGTSITSAVGSNAYLMHDFDSRYDDDGYFDISSTADSSFYLLELAQSYTLTINYKYADGTQAAEPYEGAYDAGAQYSVESPVIPGYTASETVVSGTITQNTTVNVTYTENPKHTLTITYVIADGGADAPDAYTAQLAEGASYSVVSPSVYGYEPDQAVVSGVMGDADVPVTVTYTKLDTDSKEYTITLYAVYGRANKTGETHIYWYSNDDAASEVSGGDRHVDIVGINERTAIPTPADFYVDHDGREDAPELEWEDHVFLGWARLETGDNDLTGKAHPELTESNLYLKWTGSGYQVKSNGIWTDVEDVAADEMRPYHDMYAVWASVFYIYHSGNNTVERIVRTKSGTYDLTKDVPDGFLYGGYYKRYEGMSANFNIKAVDWGTVTADNLGNGQYRQAGSNYKDANGTPYDGVNVEWDWNDSYNIDTDATKAAPDPDGMHIEPEVGKTYYVKEVPASKYLQPYLHYTYLTSSGTITNAWLISDIDDCNYQETGFVIESGRKTAHVVSSLTITAQNTGTTVRLTPEVVFGSKGVEGGYLTYLMVRGSRANLLSDGDSVMQYWRTPDGLYVTGTTLRQYENLDNAYHIGKMKEEYEAYSVSAN